MKKRYSDVPVRRIKRRESVYEMYYDFEEPVKKLAGHRVLALNRGEEREIPYCEDPCT